MFKVNFQAAEYHNSHVDKITIYVQQLLIDAYDVLTNNANLTYEIHSVHELSTATIHVTAQSNQSAQHNVTCFFSNVLCNHGIMAPTIKLFSSHLILLSDESK